MDSEVIDHQSASDKQNYIVYNNMDSLITPIPVVASGYITYSSVRSDREHGQPSNGSPSCESRPSLYQPINDTECVASTSNEEGVLQPQNTSLQPLLQRSHDLTHDSLPNPPLPNNPQESQGYISTAMHMRSLSLTDLNQTISLASCKDDGILMEEYSDTSQHPTSLNVLPDLASGEEIQVNQSYQHVLSNQEDSNQPSDHHGHGPQGCSPHPVSTVLVPSNLTCPHCRKRIASDYSVQQAESDYTGKKVFILHYNFNKDNPVLQLAATLICMGVDVTLDLFEYDNPPDSWPLWYEQNIEVSDVVLCVITEDFYYKFTNGDNSFYLSVYDLMKIFKNVVFRALFIDAEKKMEYIPPVMRLTTCYSVSSNQLTPYDDGFAHLYAFLTGQEKFPRLAPEQSSIYRPHVHVDPLVEIPDVNQIFIMLKEDTTPIRSCNSSKMFMQLASKMTGEWAPLGRTLGISEANLYAINVDHIFSVTEQAVQMFLCWSKINGSAATFGVLATAVYECGPQYWNLLDIINSYVPHDQ